MFKHGYILMQYVDDLLVASTSKESCIANTWTLLLPLA